MGDPVTPKIAEGNGFRARAADDLGWRAGAAAAGAGGDDRHVDGRRRRQVRHHGRRRHHRAAAAPSRGRSRMPTGPRSAPPRPTRRAAPTKDHRTPAMREAERVVTDLHGAAIAKWLDAPGERPDLVGWHGQTILHAPDRGVTIQLGDPRRSPKRLGIPVVFDLRQADMAAGGQGAPLVPVYHRAPGSAVRRGRARGDAESRRRRQRHVHRRRDVDRVRHRPRQRADRRCDAVCGAALRRGRCDGRARPGGCRRARGASGSPVLRRPPPKSLDRNAFSWRRWRGWPTPTASPR